MNLHFIEKDLSKIDLLFPWPSTKGLQRKMKQIVALSVVLTLGMFCSGFAEENGFGSIEGFFTVLGLNFIAVCALFVFWLWRNPK